MRSSVDFWNLLISLRATVPGLNLCALLTPPAAGYLPLFCLLAICFLGALAPVFFLAVCLVLAIFKFIITRYNFGAYKAFFGMQSQI